MGFLKNIKTYIAIIILAFLANVGFGQDPQKVYLDALDSLKTGNYESAIELFGLTTKLQPENTYAWYNKAIAENYLGWDEDALLDFLKVVEIDPTYKKGWLNLATTKKHLTDYEGAFADYRKALALDSNYHEAYYNLALMYELFNKQDSACFYFEKAQENGSKSALKKLEKCDGKEHKITTPILWLKETAKNKKYGFTEQSPILVGTGPDGGPANQRAYLNLLRDQMGKRVSYQRLGSCCAYESKNDVGFGLGMGLLDIYEISYRNEQNEPKTAKVYLSFYDYEEPKILHGFKTIELK